MRDTRTYYEILQVSPQVNLEELKHAYRRLARQYHPDLNPGDTQAEDEFKKICQAYAILADSEQRELYDRQQQPPTPNAKNFRYFYLKGIEKGFQKKYQEALENYDRAIELNPNFVESYLKRGEIYYTLGNNLAILDNCRQILEIDPHCAEAYYYQGRARYRLGYLQSALEAYQEAVQYDPDFAKAYYYRGLAYNDLKNNPEALKNLHKASELFEQQGDGSGVDLVEKTLAVLAQTQNPWSQTRIKKMLESTGRALGWLIIDPGNGLSRLFFGLEPGEAIVLGLILAIIADSIFLVAVYWGWIDLIQFAPIRLGIVGLIPFVSLATFAGAIGWIFKGPSPWIKGTLMAGFAVIPIGILALASGFSWQLGPWLLLVLTAIVHWQTSFILYKGYTDLMQFSDRLAAWATVISVLGSSWLTFNVFEFLF